MVRSMDRPGPVELSVVVPVYGCADCLRALHGRLTAALRSLALPYELVFVDDGSTDDGYAVLQELADEDEAVVVLKLSRNFGQHAAITAGVAHASGSWIVVMDCDLQDPPEAIPELHRLALAGHDIVYTRRVGRKHSLARRGASAAYFRTLNAILSTELSADYANFSIVSRKVADAFLDVNDVDRHYLMILNWLGFRSTVLPVPQEERYAGRSSYTLASLVRFAFAGLFFQTTTLLRWIIYAGFLISAVGAGLAVFFVVNYFTTAHHYPGWTSLGVLLLLLGGFIIVTTGLTGLYIGKIFTQVKGRPLYVVGESLPARSEEAARGLEAQP
jgi:polyisoprenyl-phosphate glycosyltransferase